MKFSEMKNSMKLMWGCVALGVLAVVLVAGGFGAGALFIIPCMLMLGVMAWMMMGGARGKPTDKP